MLLVMMMMMMMMIIMMDVDDDEPYQSKSMHTAVPYLFLLLRKPASKPRRLYLAATIMPLIFAISAIAICLQPDTEVRYCSR